MLALICYLKVLQKAMSDPALSSFLVREKIEQFRGFGGANTHFEFSMKLLLLFKMTEQVEQ